MKVRIKSVFTEQAWEGHVDIPAECLDHPEHALEYLFRKFNRVTEADIAWLREQEFAQPSMSVGDEVTIDDNTWVVMPIGFEELG